MSAPKLTPWFPGSVKPVRPGVYEAEWREGKALSGGRYFNYWADSWCWGDDTPDSPHRCVMPAALQGEVKRWRGLAEEPK